MHIGIIVPAYNVGAVLADTISSVIEQTHADWSMIVVDDGSTDNTAAAAASFTDPRVKLVRQQNAGVSAARNLGLMQMQADAFLFLDGDDWLALDALAALASTLDAHPDAAAAVGRHVFADHRSGPWLTFPRRPLAGNVLEPLLVGNRYANGGHILVRREAVAAAGAFRTDLCFGEDWEYWTRVALHGAFAEVPTAEPLLFVRGRPAGAYRRMAANPDAYAPCMTAIFANPAVETRVGPERLACLRAQAEAERSWIVGRELIRHDNNAGLAWLRLSVAMTGGWRRRALAAAAHAAALLPPGLRGPFRPYHRLPA